MKATIMNRITALAVLCTGIVLIIWGVSAADSFASSFSRFFTELPTDRSMWLLMSGTVLVIIGLAGYPRTSGNAP
jgi:hypothetical protein